MKTVTTLLIAAAAWIGVEAISAKPAEAFGWCGSRYACGYRYYRPVRYYRAVRYYRPVRYRTPVRRGCW